MSSRKQNIYLVCKRQKKTDSLKALRRPHKPTVGYNNLKINYDIVDEKNKRIQL